MCTAYFAMFENQVFNQGEVGDESPISGLNLLAEEVEKGTWSDNVYKDPQENSCRILTVWPHPKSYVLPEDVTEEQAGKASPTNSENYKTPPEDDPMTESRRPDVGMTKRSRYLTREFEIVIGIHVSNQFFLSLARPTNWVTTEHMSVLISMLVRRHGGNYLRGRCRFVDYFNITGIISKFAEFEKASDKLGFKWGGLVSFCLTGKTPRRNDKKVLLVDVDRVYAPMMWGIDHWVGLVINLTSREVEILDCNIPHNESDNEVNKHMAYLLRALPHVLAAFSPPSDSSHPEEDQSFSWVRPDNIYFNERSGDCGPCAVKFLEMHATGYFYEDMGQIDDNKVDIFRQKYAMDTYEKFIGNAKVQNDG
ncbi:hypothetical protein Bca52824_033313 [Brassica carinata]|uniref:Ubiquitin-like protease family profile domain-containing protein n=1 Tax=Brassica carinata TaxID=52824 RepID=A0A8X7SES4_BRACI|nr:hypothetical protein Bca52824_033313 [Brassica carinata]